MTIVLLYLSTMLLISVINNDNFYDRAKIDFEFAYLN